MNRKQSNDSITKQNKQTNAITKQIATFPESELFQKVKVAVPYKMVVNENIYSRCQGVDRVLFTVSLLLLWSNV